MAGTGSLAKHHLTFQGCMNHWFFSDYPGMISLMFFFHHAHPPLLSKGLLVSYFFKWFGRTLAHTPTKPGRDNFARQAHAVRRRTVWPGPVVPLIPLTHGETLGKLGLELGVSQYLALKILESTLHQAHAVANSQIFSHWQRSSQRSNRSRC
jgi:hypothetical protein